MKKTVKKTIGIALLLSGVLLRVITYRLMLTVGPEPGIQIINRIASTSIGVGVFLWVFGGNVELWRIKPPIAYIPGLIQNEELEEIYQEVTVENTDERGEQLNAKAGQVAALVLFVCLMVAFDIAIVLSGAGYFRPWSTYAAYFFLGLQLVGAITFFAAKKYWDKRM